MSRCAQTRTRDVAASLPWVVCDAEREPGGLMEGRGREREWKGMGEIRECGESPRA
jgi:hypothetical protein